ncbi:hypothetical protein DICPUDRAFT_40321 [Dictyostelium purpureum]|uniref:Translation elongation factor KOW-like domain-containing protein n=1 Tax=Dictyostelium purpureum TaxID=5786 RepID=F0ZY20_DICPU|nr:uncharacterized protein DICPUDRAFT_40321 [Dictyostelium purpureum]EGC31162.1 hypothetical protein DICPUDRAFT_40321 [Dictyostelium purpureum]|eukprot:XP_003292309.1 hypothetical protein DICPUDRAFT_40321 [Dictyostelium purpureum]
MNRLAQFNSLTRCLINNNVKSLLSVPEYSKRFYELEAGELKKGMFIEHKNKLFQIEKLQHQKVAMRGGFIIADIKNIIDGSRSNYKFRSAENVEIVELPKEDYVYIGEKSGKFLFKKVEEGEDDEEIAASEDQLIGYAPYLAYLDPETEYNFREYNGKVIDFKGPTDVVLKIKNITDLQNYKVLYFENGRSCKGPSYLKPGDQVQIRIPEEELITAVKRS